MIYHTYRNDSKKMPFFLNPICEFLYSEYIYYTKFLFLAKKKSYNYSVFLFNFQINKPSENEGSFRSRIRLLGGHSNGQTKRHIHRQIRQHRLGRDPLVRTSPEELRGLPPGQRTLLS